MENELIIRSAGSEDMPVISLLAHQVWPVAYGQILSKDQLAYMLHLLYNQASLINQLQEQGHRFLLASLAGDAVGFASFSQTPEPGVYKLHKLYVETGIQGQGLGRALIEEVLLAVKKENARGLLLNVNRLNKARTFYEKLGFRIVGEEDIDIGNGYFMNDYIMKKELTP